MKNKINILLIILTLFIGVKSVNAYATCPNSAEKCFYSLGASSQSEGDLQVKVLLNGKFVTLWTQNGVNYNTIYNAKYTFYDKENNGQGFAAYCHNPHLSAGVTNSTEVFAAERLVNNNCSATDYACKAENAYEAGIIAILESTSSSSYIAKLLAVRTYEKFWDLDSNLSNGSFITFSNDAGHNAKARYFMPYSYYNTIYNDSSISNVVSDLNELLNNELKTNAYSLSNNQKYSYDDKFPKSSNHDEYLQIKPQIKSLVLTGLTAAKNYVNSGVSSSEYNITKGTSTETETSKSISYTIDLRNFDGTNFSINPTCSNCSSNLNLKVTAKASGVATQTITGKTNLIEKFGKKRITLKLEFTKNAIENYCETINYNLNVEHNGAIAYKLKSDPNTQELYLLYKTNGELTTETIPGSLSYCSGSCDFIKDMCEISKSEEACKVFEKEFDSTCAYCNTLVSEVTCSETDQNIYIKEGTEKTSETSCDLKEAVNVKQCILNKQDKANNNYNAYSNDYCTISCKEDYVITLPGIKRTESGSKFSLSVNIEGIKTCYTSKINKDQFNKDYNEAKTDSARDKIQEEYNKCSNFDMTDRGDFKYNYNPTIAFRYEESYFTNMINKNLETVSNVSKSAVDTKVCTGEVTDDSYETCATSWTTDTTNASYVKKSVSVEATYLPPNQFYRIHPSGTIISAEVNGEEIENGTSLGNNYPIGYNTRAGYYNYTLKINDLGEYYEENYGQTDSTKIKLGRIWGSENSVVVNAINDECTYEGSIEDNNTNKDGTYVCRYIVDCPDCPPEIINPPECPECPPECVKCIGDTEINYRPITSEDINPNDRELGENWESDDSISTALEMKAKVTTEEIEEKGESIYDVDYNSNDGDFAMKVTLDSKMISKIREYNDKYEDNGGYLNNSLECYDYTDSYGDTYENVFCYSTFIDELINETGGPDANGGSEKVKISGGTRYLKEEDRKKKTFTSGYWTTWSQADTRKWEINTTNELAYSKKKYGADINIGPSWK